MGDKVRAGGLALGLWLASAACAADLSGVMHIKAGRAALEASDPTRARAEFRAAVAESAIGADRLVALVGLGRAEQWLGHYRAALKSFREARRLAVDTADREVADTGAARALNALEYHQEALALVAPFAAASPAATVEVARAEIALGRPDEALRFLAASSADSTTRTGRELLRETAEAQYEVAARAEAGYSFTHDSDGLTDRMYSVRTQLPMELGGAGFHTWAVTAATSEVSGSGRSDTFTELNIGDHVSIGGKQRLDLRAGLGRAAGWTRFEGLVQWEDRFTDTATLFGSAERAPIVTPVTLERGLFYDTYSVGTSVRAADHWMLVPVYFHQEFSDGNQRDGGRIRIVLTPFDIPRSTSALGAELEARAYRSTQPSAGIYFNPARYHQEQIGLIGVHQFAPGWRIRFTAGAGSETVNGSSARTWSWALGLTGHLPRNGRLELHAGRDSFASLAGGGSGYWTNGASLTVAWPFSSL